MKIINNLSLIYAFKRILYTNLCHSVDQSTPPYTYIGKNLLCWCMFHCFHKDSTLHIRRHLLKTATERIIREISIYLCTWWYKTKYIYSYMNTDVELLWNKKNYLFHFFTFFTIMPLPSLCTVTAVWSIRIQTCCIIETRLKPGTFINIYKYKK